MNTADPCGPELLETVATLSGLPESLAQQELDQILGLTGQGSTTVTLDSLREAMLAYLEMIGSSVDQLEEVNGEVGSPAESHDDLSKIQAPVTEADSF